MWVGGTEEDAVPSLVGQMEALPRGGWSERMLLVPGWSEGGECGDWRWGRKGARERQQREVTDGESG